MKVDRIRNQEIPPPPIPTSSRAAKRLFDIAFSAAGLLLFSWLIAAAYLLAAWSTRDSGFFRQTRIGRGGHPFEMIKIRTMRRQNQHATTVTTLDDPRITRVGRIFRRLKIDELPQLFNVLVGEMSFVGPRPDVPGFADRLHGETQLILAVRPGITGPATLRFRREELELADQDDPEDYNRRVIFPEKVRLNLEYVRHQSFFGDLRLILRTLLPSRGE